MAEIVRMPRLSDTMTEGVIVSWHKKIGEVIESTNYQKGYLGNILHFCCSQVLKETEDRVFKTSRSTL